MQQQEKPMDLCDDNDARYRSIIEETHAGYFFIDGDGIFRDVNAAWVRLYEYNSPSEIVGKHYSVIVRQVDDEKTDTMIAEVLKGAHDSLSGISRRKCKDDSIGYHSFTVRRVYSGLAVIGIEGFLIDIDAGNLGSDALRRSEYQYRKAEVVAGFGHWELHLDDQLITASEGASAIFGVTGTARPLAVIRSIPLFEYRNMLDRKLNRLIESDEPYDVEFQLQRSSDGGIRWVRSIAEYDPKRRVVFGVIHDISLAKEREAALVQSEHEYKALFSGMIDAFALHEIICDEYGTPIDYRFLAVNPAFEEMTDLRAVDIIGKTVKEVLPGIERSWIEKYGKVALSGNPIYFEEYSADLQRYYEVSSYRPAPGKFATAFRDVTQRKRAEEGLREANQLNQTIINGAHEGIIVYGRDLHYQVWNPFMEQLMGVSASEVIGHHPVEVFPHLRGIPHNERLELALAGEASGPIDYPYIDPVTGQSGWTADTCGPLRNTQGEIIGVIKTVQDITERKKMEDELKESEERCRSYVENAPYAIFIVDEQGKYVQVNPAACRITGYNESELLSMSIPDLLGPETLLAGMAGFAELKETGQTFSERDYLTKQGERRWWSLAAVRVSATRFLGFASDITTRKHAEEALAASEITHKTMIANICDVIAIIDSNCLIQYVSPNITQWFGWLPEDLVGTSGWRTTHPGDMESLRTELHVLLEKENSIHSVESRLKCKDGTDKLVRLTAINLIHDPNIKGVLLNLHDITDRKQLEEQLQQSHKLEAIGTLAGGIAHDFNNVLSVIIGATELALRKQIDQPTHANLQQILGASRRAKDLVDQILTFSRKADRELKLISVGPLVRDVLNMLRATLPTTIAIQFTDTGKGATVMADITQIEQVLINLCVNAGYSMRDSGGTLSVRIDQVEIKERADAQLSEVKAGRYVRLEVTDTGCGMSQDVMSRVFEPFFTTKKLGEGTGMGLAVAHGIVKSHGGEISVTSELGQGSSFEVLLPLAEFVGAHEDVAAASVVESVPEGKACILFVDDMPSIVEIGQALLNGMGYEVVATTCSSEALRLFSEKPHAFDIVITDQTMPGLTGKALAREILKIDPNVPIILCTGYSDNVSLEVAKSMGIHTYLMKPYFADDLSVAINRVLRGTSNDLVDHQESTKGYTGNM